MSLQPRSEPAIPEFASEKEQAWVRNSVDAFVLEKLKEEGLHPAPETDRATLIRRVTFDLTGLPPTPAAVADFVNDDSGNAYEKVVDRLLTSPQYGERWGQRWLDVVRYAETEGFEYDRTVHGSWRFRDYVIKSFNDDKPFDQFVREQIAGDEIGPDKKETQIAAGFYRLGAVRRNAGNQEVASSRNEVLTDRTDIIGAAFLGMDRGVRPLPRSHVRPDPAEGLLPVTGLLSGNARAPDRRGSKGRAGIRRNHDQRESTARSRNCEGKPRGSKARQKKKHRRKSEPRLQS